MEQQSIDLTSPTMAAGLGAILRNARVLVGWSQEELADRASSSQAAVSRLETGRAGPLDMSVLGRLFGALGLDARMVVEGRHLLDRVRQNDGVHAKVLGCAGRRLVGWDWLPAGEVLIGGERPRGWIDLLAFRAADRALLVNETKTDIPDFGAMQRSVAFYEREARAVAGGLGWGPRTVNVLVIALDSATIARRLADNRDLVQLAFPTPVPEMMAWLRDPSANRPRGWCLATCDPATRKAAWLRPTTLGSRRTPPVYANYADAAARLGLTPR
jgi:transcriptional regulator with XRE-family HTH domain